MGFDVGDNGQLTFINSKTTCPRCTREADILSGYYEVKDGKIQEYLWSVKDYAGVKEKLHLALVENKSAPDAIKLLAKLSELIPAAVPEARAVLNRGGISLLISFIMLLLAACDTKIQVEIAGNLNTAIDQVNVMAGGTPYFDPRPENPSPSSVQKDTQAASGDEHSGNTDATADGSNEETGSIPHQKGPSVDSNKKKKLPSGAGQNKRRAKAEHRRQFGKSRTH